MNVPTWYANRVLAVLLLVAKICVLLAGLLVPGAALARALRIPCTVATSFAGSAATLYAAVLVLQFASLRISFASLGAALATVTALAILVARFAQTNDRPAPIQSPSAAKPTLDKSQRGGLAMLGPWSAVLGIFWVIIAWRAFHEPLAGPDTEFRWRFLAEQMLSHGSLDFYPPRSALNFLAYFWVESIPPGVAALHSWAFACAGESNPLWTAPAVVLQLWTVHALLWRIAGAAGGPLAARLTCLAAAACPLLTWSVLLGQETGVTALSMVGIVWALQSFRAAPLRRWAAVAGLFALLGAGAREYGLVFPALAALGLLSSQADRRAWLAFASFAALSLAWPLRTFALAGNPFYSLPFAGLPTNPLFIAWVEHDAAALNAPLLSSAGWLELLRYLGLFALPALAGWAVLFCGALRRHGFAAMLALACAVLLGLWAASVRYTNGGLFYSLRVTSPALALSAAALGVAAASPLFGPRVAPLLRVGLLAVFVATLPATLALPRNPWRTPVGEWTAFAAPPTAVVGAADETIALLQRLGATGNVLADAPGFQRRAAAVGINAIPLWSPQADWLFNRALSPAEAARRWRASGVRHLIVTKWQTNLDFLNRHSRWADAPFEVQLVGETSLTAVFAVRLRDG